MDLSSWGVDAVVGDHGWHGNGFLFGLGPADDGQSVSLRPVGGFALVSLPISFLVAVRSWAFLSTAFLIGNMVVVDVATGPDSVAVIYIFGLRTGLICRVYKLTVAYRKTRTHFSSRKNEQC